MSNPECSTKNNNPQCYRMEVGKMRLKEKVIKLEKLMEDISTIQNQLLKELGYVTLYKAPAKSGFYIKKNNKE